MGFSEQKRSYNVDRFASAFPSASQEMRDSDQARRRGAFGARTRSNSRRISIWATSRSGRLELCKVQKQESVLISLINKSENQTAKIPESLGRRVP